MAYNDVMLCITVIKSDKCVLFHQIGSILSDKSRSIRFLIMNTTTENREVRADQQLWVQITVTHLIHQIKLKEYSIEYKFTNDQYVICMENSWLEVQATTESALQRNLEQVHISCRRQHRKVTKHSAHMLWLTGSGNEHFERLSYIKCYVTMPYVLCYNLKP